MAYLTLISFVSNNMRKSITLLCFLAIPLVRALGHQVSFFLLGSNVQPAAVGRKPTLQSLCTDIACRITE